MGSANPPVQTTRKSIADKGPADTSSFKMQHPILHGPFQPHFLSPWQHHQNICLSDFLWLSASAKARFDSITSDFGSQPLLNGVMATQSMLKYHVVATASSYPPYKDLGRVLELRFDLKVSIVNAFPY